MHENILVSVVIPVYHDWQRLKECVELLACQSIKKDEYEVIIVNNDPKESPPENMTFPDNYKIICESKPGSYAARNTGLKFAVGDILAFTDSDCLPHIDWLKNGVAAILSGETDRVAGRVDVFSDRDKMTPTECYESIFAFDQKDNVSRGVAVTANLMVRADVFDQVGLFDDALFSGGDIEWNRRATSMGCTLKYSGTVIVKHPARRTWAEMASKIRRVTAGKMAMHPHYHLQLIRSLCPPIEALAHISKQERTFFRTKVLAFCIAYRIKVFRYFYFFKLKSGRRGVERT